MTDTKINLEENSRYRVALDLAQMIAGYEDAVTEQNAREYYLHLYRECRAVVWGTDRVTDVIESGKRFKANLGLN